MKPKALILHCQTILSKYHEFSKDPGTRLTSKSSPESIRRASIANSTRQGSRNTFTTTKEDSSGADDGGGYYMPTPTSIKLSFSRPVVVDEEEILKKYLVDMKVIEKIVDNASKKT